MPPVVVVTRIRAPLLRCFDLSRDIDFHTRSLAHTGERAVAGRTSGHIGLGETVTWEGRHLGIWQRLTAKITALDPPHHFRDEQVEGAFSRFVHDHRFEADGDETVMTDHIAYIVPLGVLGRLVDGIILHRYLTRLITDRAEAIRAEAERTPHTRAD